MSRMWSPAAKEVRACWYFTCTDRFNSQKSFYSKKGRVLKVLVVDCQWFMLEPAVSQIAS